ncbi:MAG: molecular chaperone TorD family protein, partial [candidate division NC10 bacterium]|nr:molecular chaperone TorD family protein [candidate division NC10 bacterium]
RRLFGHTARGRVPPYETAYGEDSPFQPAQEMSDLAAFFRAFGLALRPAGHERIDHISCECEYLLFLARKEACALERGDQAMREETRRAARLFLRDHVGRFAPAFGKRLAREDPGGFYGALGELCAAFVTQECAWARVAAGPEVLRLRSPSGADAPMACGTGEQLLQITRALVEEAVLHALRGQHEERAFRRGRDSLYEIPDPEAREAGFRDLHAAWFERLGLGRPVIRAFHEQPSIAAATRGCRIAAARAREEEGAELFVRPPGPSLSGQDQRWVVVRLRAEALASSESLLQFLRHEFLHIADMLDPHFGYEPRLRQAADPVPERLLRDRYRVLWDATIDGRLVRLGLVPPSVRAGRLRDFLRAFPRLGVRAEETFSRFFDGASRTHADLVGFAADPGGGPGAQAEGPLPGERCPLCRFPTHAFEPDPSGLPPEVLEGVRADFPAWDPTRSLCRQCADLYRARFLEVSGAGAPPARATGQPGATPGWSEEAGPLSSSPTNGHV